MAICEICGLRTGLTYSLTATDSMLRSIEVCGACNKEMMIAKNGDAGAFDRISKRIKQSHDADLIDFWDHWNYSAEALKERKNDLSKILISSGFNFEGYRIVKYSGYISGDDVTQMPRSGIFGGDNGKKLTDALVRIRQNALRELKEAAYDLGCNAIIGVDFDYITLQPETANCTGGTLYEPYLICVTANGNAVIIEKE